jgi:hypothetical protein
MYYVETFAAGTSFYWSVVLDDASDVEFDAFATCLAEFARLPYVGGKSNIGHGKVAIELDNWRTIDPRLAPPSAAVDLPLGEKYLAHLNRRGEEIRVALANIG